MKKYSKIETKIKELQAQIDHLKEQTKEDYLPPSFKRDKAIELLKTKKFILVHHMLSWSDDVEEDWYAVSDGDIPLDDRLIIKIQNWIILSFLKECNYDA